MSQKTKKSFFSLFLAVSFLSLILVFNWQSQWQKVKADVATTTVQVQNAAPQWVVYPFEDPASATTTPTNVLTNVIFRARANDPNLDNYYLAICKNPGISPGSGGSQPICTGMGGAWCISSSTVSGATSSCSYLVQESDTLETYQWYAYVCDAYNENTACNPVYSQGSGSSGSPFVVNHRPNFNAINNNGPTNPDSNITWFSSSSDPDILRGGDRIRLYVCATAGFNPQTGCTGTTLASSTWEMNNPSATHRIPTIKPDMVYDAYVYIVDEFYLAATGTAQGANSQYTVNNVAPTISASSIYLIDANNQQNLTLTNEEATTTGFRVVYQITDANSCWAQGGSAEIVNAIAFVYRSGIGQTNCNEAGEANNNNCYPVLTNVQIQPCPGPEASTIYATTTFYLWYHADPTVIYTPWEAENWLASVYAIDDDNATSSLTEGTNGKELDMFQALGLLSDEINYGTVVPGTPSSEATSTVKATGNTGIDLDLYGIDMWMANRPTTTIPVNRQYWYLTSGTNWGATPTSSLRNFLAYAPGNNCQLECRKTTTSTQPQTKNSYWKINVEATQDRGLYYGTNTFIAKFSTSTSW